MKRLTDRILFCIKLWEMDWWFYFLGISGRALFTPSFYYIHTEEEIERIKIELVGDLRKMLEE
jgi:hypothetical protein